MPTRLTESSKELKNHILYRLAKAEIDTINAGWRIFQIVWAEDIMLEDRACHGLTDFDKAQIKLDIAMDEDLAIETVLHELTHLVLSTHGLGGGEEDKELNIKNEDATTQISRGFLQLMSLNVELFDIIFATIKDQRDTRNEDSKPTTKKSRKS